MMRTYFLIVLCCFFFFSENVSTAQPVGQLYLQQGTGANAELSYIDYPSEQLHQIGKFQTKDLVANSEFLYASSFDGRDVVVVFDRSDHTVKHVLNDTDAQWVELWNDKLVVASKEAPYLRVYDPNQSTFSSFQELFSLLDSTVMDHVATDLLVADDRAYLLQGTSLIVVDLDLEDTLAVIPTPPPYGNQNFNTSIINGKDHVFIEVDYATGAIRSSLLKVNKLTLQVETAFHVEGNASQFRPVFVDDSVFLYQDMSHYDISEDSLYMMISPSQYNAYVLEHDPQSKALFTYGGVLVPGEIQFQGPTGTSQGVSISGVQHVHFATSGNTNIDPNLVHESHIQLYPNPTVDYFQLFSEMSKKPEQIHVLNPKGQLVMSFQVNQVIESQRFDVRSLAHGGYFLELKFQDEKVIKPFVKW